ncbi:hypothetical protein ACVMB2_004285 [Sinorhizobium meliloti]|uniref:hypothetical protein n=1 Tax=Rhizobium meliloti TaxID=382 RepID=UPI000AEA2A0E|nr:hypothetical protein [Sinorhizobium meliloti]
MSKREFMAPFYAEHSKRFELANTPSLQRKSQELSFPCRIVRHFALRQRFAAQDAGFSLF